MSKEKAQYFVDVALARILDRSEGRIAKIVDDLSDDVTLGEVVEKLSSELNRTANNLKEAIVDFRDVKLSDL